MQNFVAKLVIYLVYLLPSQDFGHLH